MAQEFVPFLPTAGPTTTSSAHTAAGGFAPLAGPPAPPDAAPPSEETATHPAPVVTFQRNGERVTSIRIRCACGELIELDCVY
jgi:hypothetical protein